MQLECREPFSRAPSTCSRVWASSKLSDASSLLSCRRPSEHCFAVFCSPEMMSSVDWQSFPSYLPFTASIRFEAFLLTFCLLD